MSQWDLNLCGQLIIIETAYDWKQINAQNAYPDGEKLLLPRWSNCILFFLSNVDLLHLDLKFSITSIFSK